MAKRKFRKAKRSSHKAAATTRRRRIGASGGKLNANSPVVKWGSVAVGFFLGPKLNAQVTKMIGDKLDPKIIAGAEAGLGFLLAMRKGKKNLVQTVAGGILLGAGVKLALSEFGIAGIGPYGRVPVIGGAYGNVPVIGYRPPGYTPNHSMAGFSPNGSLARVMNGVNGGIQKSSGYKS